MEHWQVAHIKRNLSKLINLTICNTLFLAVLQEHDVLGEDDIFQLDVARNSKGKLAESDLLYRLLSTRKGAFKALIDACDQTQQSGALDILTQLQTKSTTYLTLSDELKNEMKCKLVGFQGRKVHLSEYCNHLHHLIDETFLIELEKGITPTLVNNQVPEHVKYYIQRTLRNRNRLKSSVFQQSCDDVFVVEGMEKHQLTSLVAGAETDVSGNQIECLTVRYILLEYGGDFESICKLARSPVHLIRYKDSFYEWVHSSGSVKNLQKFVDNAQDCFLERNLASQRNRVNVIADSPGMGKTVLLANVAHQISKDKPNVLIRFLVMEELVQTMSNKSITLEAIVSLIAEQSSEFKCGREIVKHILTSETCILMFDGFDEVLFHQIDIAKQILKTIVTLKSAEVFETTRPHMQEELENALNVLGYTINPFMESDQVEFLLKFWQMKGVKMIGNLRQFAVSCVNTISSEMADFERDIAGIPLQCRLLAETYTDQAIRCSELGFFDINSQPLSQINSIFEMYERHVKMRLEKCKTQVEANKNVHTYYALELLFAEHAHQFLTLKTYSLSLNEVFSFGFLEATNSGDIKFVHRTFAEFFVAWFAVETILSKKNLPLFLNELLATKSKKEFITTPFGITQLGSSFTFNYPVITYFINGFTKLHAKINNEDQTHRVPLLMNSNYYEQVSHIFFASAVGDYQYVPIAAALCFDTSGLSEKTDSNNSELLLISAKHSGVALMKTFCDQCDQVSLKSLSNSASFVLTPLHVAVQRGHYNLVEFLTRKYEAVLTNLRYLLHFCVFETLAENEKVINDKVQIIKLLLTKSNVWIDEELSDGTVPILQENVHYELLKNLLVCEADVNLLDKNGNTILHKITENPVTPEFYHWLVVSLSDRKFKYFNQLNWKRVSPLHCAVKQVELLPETLKLFHSNGTDFNALDKQEESPIFYAIRGGRPVSLIRALIELGADWKKTNGLRETVLHICSEHAHYDAIEYFLKTLKMDVNLADRFGGTPLHVAVMRRSEVNESIQQLLITLGADVNSKTRRYRITDEKNTMISRLKSALRLKPFSNNLSSRNDTPFKIALGKGKGLTLSIIKLLEKHGLSIRPDEASEAIKDLLSNDDITSSEIDKEFVKVLEFLIGKRGEINKNIWESQEMQRNMHAIIRATDMSCLLAHLKTSGLLTDSELEEICNNSTDSINKCERFYKAVQTKKRSFERICILMITSNQMSCLSLLRKSLQNYDRRMFVTPPTLTNQFFHSQQNSSLNTIALVTTNPKLTLLRIRETIEESVAIIEEADMSSELKKTMNERMIVVKVRVVTTQLITKLEESRTAHCKIILVCSRVSEDVENCHVTTDSLTTWDAISIYYKIARVRLFDGSWSNISLFCESPLMLSKLCQMPRSESPYQSTYSVVRFKAGHIDIEFQTKTYLCPTIFHYVLPDKLVFTGISIEKLKEYARFGHKIGVFGEEDVDNLDFVVVKESHQFDEVCKQTSENVHLIEYEQEKGDFRLVETWGWDENVQRFLKKPLCEGFPHCDCTPGNGNSVVKFISEAMWYFYQFECLRLPIRELTPKMLKIMKLEDAEELFSIRALLKRFAGEQQAELIGSQDKSHSEQVVTLVTEQLSTFLVESELYHVAINTLFPILAEQKNVVKGLEKYKLLGMLTENENSSLVFVHHSLAWYFVAKLLMGLTKTIEFESITSALRKKVFQNCVKPQKVQLSSEGNDYSICVKVNSSKPLLCSYEFINIMCFRFINALLKNSDKDNISIRRYLKSILAPKPEGKKWTHACVNANLFNLLQLIICFNTKSLSSEFEWQELVVLAVYHSDVPITQFVVTQFENKTKRKWTDIKIYLLNDYQENKEISMVLLAEKRGNYGLVEYLLNDDGIRDHLQTLENHEEVGRYCVEYSCNDSGYQINDRKRIVNLLLQTDMSLAKHIKLSSSLMHVDLIVYLINLGMDVHTKNIFNENILHLCSKYLSPQEYHEVVQIIHSKNIKSIARLLQEFDRQGRTAFHVAVQNLELLHETLALFSETGINFNALTFQKESVFFLGAKKFRSARLLHTLFRFGADILGRDRDGQPASVWCKHNQTALRYLSSQGVAVYDTH